MKLNLKTLFVGIVTATIPAGVIIGAVSDVETFRGIPYADSPAGLERLKPPKRRLERLDNFNATLEPASCPQMNPDWTNVQQNPEAVGAVPVIAGSPQYSTTSSRESEDCLTLNIQRPRGTTEHDRLPVVFWIYGGGFLSGAAHRWDAALLMQLGQKRNQSFIFVAANYRVNGFGFLGGRQIKEAGSSNLGLLDQRMGLEWVADNIGALGGNPDKVTVIGESAGAMSTFDQLVLFNGDATYNGKSLFHGAIMSSGNALPVDPIDSPRAQAIYDRVAARADCPPPNDTLDCLRRCDYKTLAAAFNAEPHIVFTYQSLVFPYLPRPDGKVLVDSPEAMVKNNQYHAVPVMMGNQEDEATMFAFGQWNITSTDALVTYFHETMFAHATKEEVSDFVQHYPEDSSAGSPFRTGGYWDKVYFKEVNGRNETSPGFKRVAAILGDVFFTLTRRLAVHYMVTRRPDIPVWSYMSSYDYVTGTFLPWLGTMHGSDLLRIFRPDQKDFSSRSTCTYWLNFIQNQNPNNGTGVGIGRGKFPYWPLWARGNKLLWFRRLRIDLLADNFRSGSYKYMKANTSTLYF
ncbi:putative extracellular lipase [Stachybotrys elegans]|uniref:Extracellular lipase n=1 Tax=Stachybotrys elegans TaxID=80388 RepID=A0A8K0SGP2_9HYPO|nr:putative extracellular lipase [Stachybotrys elegans]